MWLLGRLCNHQECKSCGETLTRQHGVECAGANTYLQEHLPALYREVMDRFEATESERYTCIDFICQVLNHPTEQMSEDMWVATTRHLATAIQLISTICCGYEPHQPNDEWTDEDRQRRERIQQMRDQLPKSPPRPKRRRTTTAEVGRIPKRRREQLQQLARNAHGDAYL